MENAPTAPTTPQDSTAVEPPAHQTLTVPQALVTLEFARVAPVLNQVSSVMVLNAQEISTATWALV